MRGTLALGWNGADGMVSMGRAGILSSGARSWLASWFQPVAQAMSKLVASSVIQLPWARLTLTGSSSGNRWCSVKSRGQVAAPKG